MSKQPRPEPARSANKPSLGARSDSTESKLKYDRSNTLELLAGDGNDRSTKHRGEKNNNIAQHGRPNSGSRRTSTPTKQIDLQGVRRRTQQLDDTESTSSSSSTRREPLVRQSSGTRRTPTPTKQIALQAVRRKADQNDDGDWHLDKTDLRVPHNTKPRPLSHPAERSTNKLSDLSLSQSSTAMNTHSENSTSMVTTDSMVTSIKSQSAVSMATTESSQPPDVTAGSSRQSGRSTPESEEFDTDLESGEESSGEETEDEPQRAPNELLMEFVACMMQQEYKTAQKLCAMILMYEPDNQEALSFKPLLEQKLQLEAEETTSSEESSDSGEETDSEGDDDDDDDESGDSSSSESADDDDDENTTLPDSGVSSTSETS